MSQAAGMLAALGVRCWIEHIPSADKLADALSRDAWNDPTVRMMLDSGSRVEYQPVLPPFDLAMSYEHIWRRGSETFESES